jgi:drug/metabolite transporter (DMT)-like permease
MHFDLWITPTLIALVGAMFCLVKQWRRRDWTGLAVFICLGAYFLLRLSGHYANYQSWASAGFALAAGVWLVRKA